MKRFFKKHKTQKSKKQKKVYICKKLSILQRLSTIKYPIISPSPLYYELISLGAFVGTYYKWTHFSQNDFIHAYKNNYSFYNIEKTILLFTKAIRFLKYAIKNKKSVLVFVGNPSGDEDRSRLIFRRIKHKYFPCHRWKPGFLSKKPLQLNYILVIFNLSKNYKAFHEGVLTNTPIVGFATPSCDIRGVDYPILMNLHNSNINIWFVSFCRALFFGKKTV